MRKSITRKKWILREFHFLICAHAYEALKSDDKGSHAKTTKEGFLYNILLFLQNRDLLSI